MNAPVAIAGLLIAACTGFGAFAQSTGAGAVENKRVLHFYKPNGALPTELTASFVAFTNRFVKESEFRIYDRMLKKTWFVVPDPTSANSIVRLDWGAAKNLAGQVNARLPRREELLSLITLERHEGRDTWIDASFFPLNPRTKKCWASSGAWLLRPYQKTYVDFERRGCGRMSVSEAHVVLLISKTNSNRL